MGAKRHAQLGGLTPKEELLCRYYCDIESPYYGNQTEAYKHAYNKSEENVLRSSLWTMACEKFREPHIATRVQELYSELAATLTPQKIKNDIEQIANNAVRDADKLRGKELLGKTHALFIDKNETEVTISALALDEDEIDETVAS